MLLELAGYNHLPPEAPRPARDLASIPHQLAPTHDSVTPPDTVPIRRPENLLRKARWTSPRSSRPALALLLLAALTAAVTTGSGVITDQSTPALAVTLACLVAASVLYAALVAIRPLVVELDEVELTVRARGRYDRFNLANPFQDVVVKGKPGTSRWTLTLGCPDGRTVVVNGRMVDSRRLHQVVLFAQKYAERERLARVERFSR